MYIAMCERASQRETLHTRGARAGLWDDPEG